MSTTLAFRLILGLLVGGVLTFSVWDRSYTELEERPTDEDTRTGMPRFRSFAAVEMLPTMLVMYLVISFAIGGREMAVQYLLGLLLRVFLLIGVYYVLLLAALPLLRRHISARVCAVLWLLPGYLYFLAQVSSVQRADPGGERMLVLHASGTLVTVLLAVWAAGAIGVFAWKIISHLRFRRRVLKDAVVVRDEQTLAVGAGARLARGDEVDARPRAAAHDAAVDRPVSEDHLRRPARAQLHPGGAFAHPAPRDHPSQPPGSGLEIFYGLLHGHVLVRSPDVGRHAQKRG